MKVKRSEAPASQNLLTTYLRLGLAVRGAQFRQEEGFQSCLGEMRHPICNFAADLDLNPWSTRRLVALASTRECFNVYRMPGDGPDHIEELLSRAGFTVSFQLAQMVAEGRPCARPAPMREITMPLVRLEVSRFMADQFFTRHAGVFRTRVAEATAASGIPLFTRDGQEWVDAAVMISEDAGILGIYNLCVASARRGGGIGGEIVEWALDRAHRIGIGATLQCERRLAPWYERYGFVQTGTVDVYNLRDSARPAIINSLIG